MESYEINYVPIYEKVLTVAIKNMYHWQQLGILAQLSTYEYYVYIFTGESFDGYPRFFYLEEYQDIWKRD